MPEVMTQILEGHASKIGVCHPGIVEKYDRINQVVQVRIATKKTDGSERPVVPNAPVIFPGAYWDIQVGEGGILVIADEDWRTWWRTGEISTPESVAQHELSSAFFVPGLTTWTAPRSLAAGSMVVPSTDLRLGIWNSTEPVLCGDKFEDAIKTYVEDVYIFCSAVSGVITALGGDVTGQLAALLADTLACKAAMILAKSSAVTVAD